MDLVPEAWRGESQRGRGYPAQIRFKHAPGTFGACLEEKEFGWVLRSKNDGRGGKDKNRRHYDYEMNQKQVDVIVSLMKGEQQPQRQAFAAGEHTEQYRCAMVRTGESSSDLTRAWTVNSTHTCDGGPSRFRNHNPLLYVNSISTEDTCKLQNVEVSIRNEGRSITYVALRAINVGEELVVSYGHGYFTNVNYTRFECDMPLVSRAAARGDAERLRGMLRRRPGEDVSHVVNVWAHGWTPLHEAARRGHEEAVAVLLAAGASVDLADSTDDGGSTPLNVASHSGFAVVVEMLLAAGASVNQANTAGVTPLYVASANDHTAVVEMLLAAGASVDQANTAGVTPLYVASANDHTAVVDMLLAAGASVDQANTDGSTPLYVASSAENDHTAVVEMLLAAGAAVDRANGEGRLTALYIAAETGSVETLNVLLAAGAAIDQTNKEGFTSLYIASQEGHVDAVKMLVEAGAAVGHAKEGAFTPLFVAADSGYIDIVKLLVTQGHADPRQEIDGLTPIMAAKEAGHDAIVEILKTY